MQTKVLLVGAGGYGGLYVEAALSHPQREIQVVGVVDPYVKSSRVYPLIEEKKIPLFDTVEAFYAQGQADLAVIVTPLQFHAQQTQYALEHGSHVLLEKPIAPNYELAKAMMDTRDATGRILAIGYQWCYDETMLRLKADVDAGKFGLPVCLRASVIAPRDNAYYNRGLKWAGKKYDQDGRPIFDSVAANATAHSLENMIWLCGKGFQGCEIEKVEAETARVNDIEMYDTAVIRLHCAGGAKLHFVVSHAAGRENPHGALFEYVFEKATIRFGGFGSQDKRILVTWKDGGEEDYGISLGDQGDVPKLWTVVDAIEKGGMQPCPAETAAVHTWVMDQVQLVCPEPYVFSAQESAEDQGMLWVPGLIDTLRACYEQWKLPSELYGAWLS